MVAAICVRLAPYRRSAFAPGRCAAGRPHRTSHTRAERDNTRPPRPGARPAGRRRWNPNGACACWRWQRSRRGRGETWGALYPDKTHDGSPLWDLGPVDHGLAPVGAVVIDFVALRGSPSCAVVG
eukprot:4077551-Pleurochrysis_carterae.AAC.6